MRVGERVQVTIPKEIRERFGIGPDSEVEFHVVKDSIVLQKKGKKLNLAKWKGYCRNSFRELGYCSVDRYIEDVRGR